MEDRVAATRSELLAKRARLSLARQGRDLLERKRDQLIVEYRRVVERASSTGETLARTAVQARRALRRAEVAEGPEALRSAALATRAEIPLQVRARTVMGVRVAEIDEVRVRRPLALRGYGLAGSSARVDAVATAFEQQIEQVLALATMELRLRRIAREIGRTTRRVNALERVVVPRLERDARRIADVLREREREDAFRRKRLATRKRAKAAAARGTA